MKHLAAFFILLLLLVAAAPAKDEKEKEKKRFTLYAEMKIGFYVDLGDGRKWAVERGDTFPVIMFKEQHTKVILQLAGTQFWINSEWVRTIEEKDITPLHLATYRKHVEKYLEQQAEDWKTKAGSTK